MNAKTFFLVIGTALAQLILVAAAGAQLPACTAARFLDWKARNCWGNPGVQCPPCVGMPRWSVSQPHISVTLTDDPLSYLLSSGERMTFRWTYQQRTQLPEAWHRRERNRSEVIPLRIGEVPVNWGDSCQGVTLVQTNATWSHNWWSGLVLWDPFQETNSVLPNSYAVDYSASPPETYFAYSGAYSALALLGEGGVLHYEGPTAGQPNGNGEPRLEVVGPPGALGGPRIPIPVPGWNPYPPNSAGVIWVEQPRFGMRLVYPDGRQDVYGLVFMVGAKPLCPGGDSLCVGRMENTARLYLTQRIDPQGRITRLGYQPQPPAAGQPAYALRYVVDPDGRTNTYSYHPTNRNQLTRIDDPDGRSLTLGYDPVYGTLTSIVDAAQLTNTFQYQTEPVTYWNVKTTFPTLTCHGPPDPAVPPYATNRAVPLSGWLSSYTTPYGTTSFEYFEQLEPGYAEAFYQQRAVRVTGPDGAKQLFLYHHKTDFSTPDSVSPGPDVSGWTFDDGNTGSHHPQLYHRNSFHWGARQYDALAGLGAAGGPLPDLLNSIATNGNAYRLARLQHWLLGPDLITATGTLSAEREPAPDATGATAGAWTWYAYGHSSNPELESAAEPPVGCAATLRPDGPTQFTDWDYTATGRVTRQRESYTRPDGGVGVRTDWFNYATNGIDLLSASNSLGQFVTYTWSTNHQILGATNALNEGTTITYVDLLTEKKPWVITSPSGQTLTFSYHTGNWTNINGTNVYVWRPDARFIKQIQWHPGPTWNFGYEKGLVKYATNDLGLWLAFTWDDLLRPTSTTYPDNTYTSNRYDKLDLVATRDRLGHWTSAGYDALQRPVALTNANGAVTRLDWCGCGALNSVTDALTNTTLFYYNNQGALTAVSNQLSALSYQRNDLGQVIRVSDGLNRALTFGYNQQGLVTSVSNAFGPLERLVFDAADRAIQVTDENNVTVTNTYDLLNRLTARGGPDGFGESYGWSPKGLVAHTNRAGQVTRLLRDNAGRLLAVTNANNEVTRVTYNTRGQITDLWDGLNQHTQFGFDEYGRRRSRTDALNRTTYWDYNPNGWLTNRVTPQFGGTSYSYDNVGNLTAIHSPLSTINYFYDLLNQLTNLVDTVGMTKFTHNANGQLTSEDGPWAEDTVSYSYTEGLRTGLSINDPQSTINFGYGYDNAWRMTSLTSPAGNFSYGYGAPNSGSALVRSITLPNGGSITNHFDALARLDATALKNKWGHVLDGYSYTHDLLGLRTNIVRDLGWTASTVAVGYDDIAQLTSWSAKETGGALRLNEQNGWAYDPAHNLLRRTNSALVQTFNNDAANQLATITRTGPLTVTGNTPAPATNLTVNGNPAQIYADYTFASSGGVTLNNGANSFTNIAQNVYGLKVTNTLNVNLPVTVPFAYDLNGNLTNDGLRNFSYDFENRLTTNWVAGQWKTEFVYDGLGRRRITRDYGWTGSAWVKTNETRLIYDGLLPIQERDASNDPLVTYTRGLDLSGSIHGAGGIGGLLARTDANGSIFYHADGVGNITALMDANGDVVGRYLYNPFGKLIGKWGAFADVNIMRFSSMPEHHGLSLYFARPYDINLQRWLARDPIGELGGVNLYGFVGNHPLNAIDPLGFAYGNPVSGPTGPVGPADGWSPSLHYPNGYLFVPNTGPAIPPGSVVDQIFEGSVIAGSTMVPGVGEAMDADVLFGRDSNWNERIMAAGSLFANFATYGLLPNYGALKAVKPCPSRTEANLTRGWKAGDPINNLTSKGNVPAWDTVRQRFWKNEALNNPSGYSAENLSRMQSGLAPQNFNKATDKWESMELHHTPPQRDGGLFDFVPVTPEQHGRIDPFRKTGN